MSTFRPFAASCAECSTTWSVEIALGLHITRLPHVREQLVRGTFQVFACPQCQTPTLIESAMVYTDFQHNEYVAVESGASSSWQSAVARHETVFRDCFVDAPAIAQELGRPLRRRLVFGLRALGEKLVAWDAGLDDRVIEAVKGDMLKHRGLAAGDAMLRIVRVLDGGHLLFAIHEPRRQAEAAPGETVVTSLAPPVDFVTATADSYAARAAAPSAIRRDYPWLGDDWLVDLHDGPHYLHD